MSRLLDHFPKPLLDDLVAGRWLPVVGAGMSRNAVVPAQRTVPLWDELGKELAKELEPYPYSGALDAISAYCHEYGRPKLVERVGDILMVNGARPGAAHEAFCLNHFNPVVTTNIDFLLERQYEINRQYCRPIIDEDQLAVNGQRDTTVLIKLHGDLHHPARLVLTEEDYDAFLDKYPLIATYLASLLINRTAVLIGYSLDDPDFRQIWQIVGERLGKARRLAYSIMVDAKPTEIARFARRGVRVLSLPGDQSNYSTILAQAFNELNQYRQTHIIPASIVIEEDALSEFSLPQEAVTRLCFFSLPLNLLPQYRDQVFPLAERAGLVPVTETEVVAPGDSYAAKVDAMIRRSEAFVVDLSPGNKMLSIENLRPVSAPKGQRRLIVLSDDYSEWVDVMADKTLNITVVRRTGEPIANQPALLKTFEKWFVSISAELQPRLAEEPLRLLRVREYRAAVISAIALLERVLRTALELEENSFPARTYSLVALLDHAVGREFLGNVEKERIRHWMHVRNSIVHSSASVSPQKANEIVNGVMEIVSGLQARKSSLVT